MGSSSGPPSGRLFTIEDAPGAGRGVFASRDLAAGKTILVANDLSVHVLFREYRGEICHNCFAYGSGAKQPVKDANRGLAFCSEQCQRLFALQSDELCMTARAAVEKLIRRRAPSSQHNDTPQGPRPTPEEIGSAWEMADIQTTLIRGGRLGAPGRPNVPPPPPATKAALRGLQRALSTPVAPDVISFLLAAVLANYNSYQIAAASVVPWARLQDLENDPAPYLSARELDEYIASYLHLLATLPVALLPFVSGTILRATKSRETYNSFGIRSLDDEGVEFFGYGVWPSASYFNHSCGPNLVRRRDGRAWVFSAGRDIKAGEQLYISYVNGGTSELCSSSGGVVGWKDRAGLLKKTWGFDCVCQKCKQEALSEATG
jgi:hypothetical protein